MPPKKKSVHTPNSNYIKDISSNLIDNIHENNMDNINSFLADPAIDINLPMNIMKLHY